MEVSAQSSCCPWIFFCSFLTWVLVCTFDTLQADCWKTRTAKGKRFRNWSNWRNIKTCTIKQLSPFSTIKYIKKQISLRHWFHLWFSKYKLSSSSYTNCSSTINCWHGWKQRFFWNGYTLSSSLFFEATRSGTSVISNNTPINTLRPSRSPTLVSSVTLEKIISLVLLKSYLVVLYLRNLWSQKYIRRKKPQYIPHLP